MLTHTDIYILVGLLSKAYHPDKVDVELGDMVYDVAAEEERDIDVTITARDESGNRFVYKGLEVKDEGRPLDVTKVEQLCCKMRDMPDLTYRAIVSASGYTAPARKKAAHYGVHLLELPVWDRGQQVFEHVAPGAGFHVFQTYFMWKQGPHVTLNPNQNLEPATRQDFGLDVPLLSASNKAIPNIHTIADMCDRLVRSVVNGVKQQYDIQSIDVGDRIQVDTVVRMPETPIAQLPGNPLPLVEARVQGLLEKVTEISPPEFKLFREGRAGEPMAACAVAELKSGELVGLSVTNSDRSIRLIVVQVSDRNKSRLHRQRL